MTDTYTMQYWDGHGSPPGERLIDGDLSNLSAQYLAFCKANSDFNHGPATLRRGGEDVGFISSLGQAYLKQPSHYLAFDPVEGYVP